MINNPYVQEIENHRDLIFQLREDFEPRWSEVFPANLPLIVDIGCGAGNFIRDAAIARPDFNYVGMELRFKRLVKASEKFRKRNLDNVRLLQGRGEEIRRAFPTASVYGIHINFPDPWAKKKQRKHRIIKPEYLDTLREVLKPGGYLSFKTDHREYFLEATEVVKNAAGWTIEEYTEDLHRSEYAAANIPTEFEQLFRGKGMIAHYLKAIV